MNVLFLNYSYPIPEKGGAERVIYNLIKYFQSSGINSFIGYFEGDKGDIPYISGSVNLTYYKKAHHYLRKYINDKDISIIISFKTVLNRKLLEAIKLSGCGFIASLHRSPYDHIEKTKILLQGKYKKKNIKQKLKQQFGLLYIKYVKIVNRLAINRIFSIADRYVLLSSRYKKSFCEINGIENTNNKIVSIANSLSFDSGISNREIMKKEKKVLIVSRMVEKSKRIFLALDIWREFITDPNFHDWELLIVGDGEDLPRYEKYVKNNEIKKIYFEGRQNPYSYYKRASIFLMTSSTEGFPNTLIEAQQMGCVPIAYNSFDSLTKIIENNYNGFIIPNNDKKAFLDKFTLLIENNELCMQMGMNAVQSCQKFNINIIGKQWKDLIFDVYEKIVISK